jgi:hypothetical protein
MGEGRSRLGGRNLACVIGALALLALLALVPGAAADLSFCPPGSGPGQCEKQQGVALDTETGHLYVADKGNNRVDVFKEDGEFLFSFAGGFTSLSWIAVDNGAASPSHHDVYVVDDHQVKKFDPSGVQLTGSSLPFGNEGSDPGEFEEIKGIGVTAVGVVYVADAKLEGECKVAGVGGNEFKKRVQKFNEAGELTGVAEPTDAPCGAVSGFAVDPGGDFYLSNQGASNAIRKYGPGAEPICEVDKAVETTALAVDPAGRLLSAQGEPRVRGAGARFRPITQYDSSCQPLRRFAYGAVEGTVLCLVAPEASAEEEVFLSEEGQGIHFIEQPPPGPGPIIAAVEAGPLIGNTKATLAAEVNPEGKATTYHFEYVDQAGFEASGFSSAAKTTEEELEVPSGTEFKLHVAEALAGCPDPVKEASEEGKCLLPETTYHFRVVAKYSDGKEGNSPLEGEAFTTKPRVELGDIWSSAVGVDTARLHGEVNPLGIPTTGYFEYVDDASFQESGFDEAIKVPAVGEGEAPIDFGAGESFTARSAQLFPLLPATTYRYRLVVEGPLLEGQVISSERAFKTFATKAAEGPCAANEDFRTGASALLPDCRAYEMVSPLDKEGGDIVVLEAGASFGPAVLNQSAVSGSKLAYGSVRAFGDVKAAFWTSQFIAARGPEGWASHAISPPHGPLLYEAVADLADTELKAFSPDLCEAWLRTVSDPILAPGAIEGYPNLYRQVDEGEECGGPSYEALTTAKPPHIASGVLPGYLRLELQGTSADGSHTIYIAPDNLPGSGAPDLGGGDNASQLYVWAGGPAPAFVCYLPSGEAWEGPCSGGTSQGSSTAGHNRSANEQGAISADGQRVFWTAFSGEGGPGKIYLREHPEQGQVAGECGEAAKACTIAVSEEAEELSGTGKEGSRFLAAASDGSKAIFATGEDLYEFEVGSEMTILIAHHALPSLASGILGASEDASQVYFVSTDALGGENGDGAFAQPGEPNLYLWHEGTITFIATLSEQDVSRSGGSTPIALSTPIASEPRRHLARVSPDGLHAAFMSDSRELSEETAGYDNTDANSGEADTEVFLYDATANGGVGKLVCASCNPSGARAAGANLGGSGKSNQFWAAAQIPAAETITYAARVLSDDGNRLFFESSDALVSRDTNGKRDVYEWEALGRGGCGEGNVTFSPQAEGCIDLISSGQSPRDSEFVDASPSGNDAFFTTLSSLLPQDYGLVDVYDARVGGGYPPPVPPKVECEGEACQSPPPPPQAPTPASSALGGSRQALPNEKHCGKGKRRVVRKGKARCVAQHKRNRKGQGQRGAKR